MTQAELEEYRVRKLRAEGTPCTAENFNVWQEKFQAEMEAKFIEEENTKEKEAASSKKKDKGSKKKNINAMKGRLTGFEHFSGKGGVLNLDDIEAAVDKIAGDSENLDVNEELFDDDDDLDDLDFDSDEDSDDSDEAPDI